LRFAFAGSSEIHYFFVTIRRQARATLCDQPEPLPFVQTQHHSASGI
jgi:hypothetical protein